MTGAESGEGDSRRGEAFHGPAGVQRGSGNLQVNFHEHRASVLSACAVALVCVAAVIAVRVGGGSSPGPTASPTNTAPAPAPGPSTAPPGTAPPGTAEADPSVLTGRLVNDDSGLCLRVAGADDRLVPVQDTCTGSADRTWMLARADGGATRTLRNGYSGRCLAATGPENDAPVHQLTCTPRYEGQRWELLWGTGARSGQFMLRSIGPAKCLLVRGPAAGRPAAQTSCGAEYADQWWRLAP
ncbi:ricin-type beta-trefoil lectin domain protein [Streptomyces sp. NPDC127106]|uniref:RICIN domain-containing protein n=1 Tax=Streptomyces sp. NPDC127106 TaxID=3345360 RepID=UPI003628D41A